MARGDILPVVSDVIPLADASKAHQLMENSQHFGKIVLKINEADR